jgi:peroxiredoxin
MDIRALADTTVLDINASPVRLGDVWVDRPALVVWLRHFGCLFCREQAAELDAARPRIEAMGAELVFVGNGTPRAARWFRDKFAPGSTMLTDPDLRSYQLIGARSGILSTLGPRAWGPGLRAFRRGARQSSVKGHPFQQGAVLLITPDGDVAYSHISVAAGDHPTLAEVLASVRDAQPMASAAQPA